ncbi:MAG TPA: hypothetical protein G4N98_09460 [Thermoflexia bacterium]|nr:hypothetical protein [Thermoflexia bacterium]
MKKITVHNRANYLFGVLLALSAGGWASAQLIPAAREQMLAYACSFALTIIVTAALWWRTRRSSGAEHTFWQLLALGWSLNLAGNLAWAARDMLTGAPAPIFSWLDAFYLARYLLLFRACIRYPRRWRTAAWLSWSAVTLLSGSLIWLLIFRPALALPGATLAHFWGGVFYIILDGALLTASLLSWRAEPSGEIGATLILFTLAMLFYGVANWLNFDVRLVSLEASSRGAALGWLLTDLLIGVAALIHTSHRDIPKHQADTDQRG